jgi:hypothetical protein
MWICGDVNNSAFETSISYIDMHTCAPKNTCMHEYMYANMCFNLDVSEWKSSMVLGHACVFLCVCVPVCMCVVTMHIGV